MINIIASLWPIVGFFALGYSAKKVGIVPDRLPHRLNLFAIRVVFPAIILLSIPKLELANELYFAILAPWLAVVISAFFVILVSRAFCWPRDIQGALLILTALGNTGFLGLPMIKAFFGLEHVAVAVVYDQLGTFILVTTYATILVALYSGEEKISSLAIVKKVLFFPPFVTLIIALLLPTDTLQPIESILEIMATAVIPITMLSIGMQFSFRVDKSYLRPLVFGLTLKMLALPIVIAILGYWLSISPVIWQSSVFQSATPPMVTGAVLLTAHNIAPKFTATMLGFGTILALIWLPVVYWLLNA